MNNIHFFTTHTGRLGNLLFVCLHAYILSKNKKSIFINVDKNTQLKKDILNIGDYYLNLNDVKDKNLQIIDYGNRNWQESFQFYTPNDIFEFTKKTLCRSSFLQNILKNKANLDTSCSIHIRATDYLDNIHYDHYYINRDKYIKNAIEYLPANIDTIDIYSDDIEYSKTNFDYIFKNRFKYVNYIKPGVPEEDLLKLSCYKYKILFNSSFSHWSAYISQSLFDNPIIVCPYKYCCDPEISNYKTPSINWILLKY